MGKLRLVEKITQGASVEFVAVSIGPNAKLVHNESANGSSAENRRDRQPRTTSGRSGVMLDVAGCQIHLEPNFDPETLLRVIATIGGEAC